MKANLKSVSTEEIGEQVREKLQIYHAICRQIKEDEAEKENLKTYLQTCIPGVYGEFELKIFPSKGRETFSWKDAKQELSYEIKRKLLKFVSIGKPTVSVKVEKI